MEPNYVILVIKNNKIVYKLWHNCSSYGHNIEINMQLLWALLKSIIGKKLSIISQGLTLKTNLKKAGPGS